MRPLTFGVLLSVGPAKSGSDPGPATTHRGDRELEAAIDLRSASDLVSALRGLGHQARVIAADEDLDLGLRGADVDACLLALHGRRGGAGDVQALLSVRGIPYAGPSAAAAALAFDKVRARQMMAYHNLPVLPAVALGRDLKASERALALLGWPCYVKPRRGAHGLGVTALDDLEQVRPAIERALDLDRDILLERAAEGIEVQVVMLGERVLGAVELVERDGMYAGEVICPPRLSRGRMDGIHNLARRTVAALGLYDGITRVDLLVHERHNEVVLEAEPLPTLAADGVVARVAKAGGISYEALVSELVDRLVLRVPEVWATQGPVQLQ